MVNRREVETLLEDKIRQQRKQARPPRRPRRYKTSVRIAHSYVVLDFETTGFRSGADQIIQIGAVKYEDHERTRVFDTLVNPKRHISPRITQLTGITNESVKEAPLIEDVITELIDFIGDLPIVAHNASFDMGFLYAVEDMTGIPIPEYTVIDTVQLSRKAITETPDHKLTTLSRYLKLEHEAHNAVGDCLVTAALYQHCLRVVSPLK